MRRGLLAIGAGLVLSGNGATVAASPPDSPAAGVIFSNNPSIVRLEEGGRDEPRCVRFQIAAARPVRLLVATAGLGDSRLADGTGGCPGLASARWAHRLFVSLDGSFRPRALALQLDPRLAETTEPAQGEIIAVDQAGNRATLSLKAGPNPPPSLWTAFTWFLGLLSPILIGAIIAEAGRRFQIRNAERLTLDNLRELQGRSISTACEEIKAVLEAEHMERPGQMVYDILNKHKILESLPRSTRRKMAAYCRANQMNDIVAVMKKEFPMCDLGASRT
jgi:hypothetical protein